MALNPALRADIVRTHQRLLREGSLLSEPQLAHFYAYFAAQFGPDALAALDGPELLVRMHDHGNRESLVYWLEFKDDEEFPGRFGSIVGGSALKFGIYRRKETGAWMTGTNTAQRVLSLEEAVAVARKHRDQLAAGADVLRRFSSSNTSDYAALQRDLLRVGPDVADTAWGHKYFSLLFPDVLDAYHVESYQQFHLIKLLQTPPAEGGRYAAAGQFIALGRELSMPMQHLGAVLNERHGRPHNYFRVGTGSDTVRRAHWPEMRDGNFAAIGWPALGDLSGITSSSEGKALVEERLSRHYPNNPQTIGRLTTQIVRFVAGMEEGAWVLAADGATILGIGRIKGPYAYVPDAEFPHRRPVEWMSLREWPLPEPEGLRTTCYQLHKSPKNRIEAERHILEAPGSSPLSSDTEPAAPPPPLEGVLARIQTVLERKGQVILYGPPGTGKTHWAERAARELAARSWFGRAHEALSDEQRLALSGAVTLCSFHAAYGYEDFLEGYRPVERNGALVFERRDGIFKRLCDEARQHPDKGFYLIVDEINRGDIPRIFGELLTALEKSRRGAPLRLVLSGSAFSVPGNVFLLGTMNTADRSIALLDAALRRRFGFIELLPDPAALGTAAVDGLPLGPWLDALNQRILAHVRRDARNLQVGHAYLLHEGRPITEVGRFVQVLRDDLVPLLEEYCYEDYEALGHILGAALVHRERKRIDETLFRPGREKELVQALLEPIRDITTSAQAIASEAGASPGDDDGDDGTDGAP